MIEFVYDFFLYCRRERSSNQFIHFIYIVYKYELLRGCLLDIYFDSDLSSQLNSNPNQLKK